MKIQMTDQHMQDLGELFPAWRWANKSAYIQGNKGHHVVIIEGDGSGSVPLYKAFSGGLVAKWHSSPERAMAELEKLHQDEVTHLTSFYEVEP